MTVKKGTLVAACVVELQWTGPSCGRALQSVLVVAGEMGKSVFPTWCETATTVSFCALAASAADKTRSIIIAFMTLFFLRVPLRRTRCSGYGVNDLSANTMLRHCTNAVTSRRMLVR